MILLQNGVGLLDEKEVVGRLQHVVVLVFVEVVGYHGAFLHGGEQRQALPVVGIVLAIDGHVVYVGHQLPLSLSGVPRLIAQVFRIYPSRDAVDRHLAPAVALVRIFPFVEGCDLTFRNPSSEVA